MLMIVGIAVVLVVVTATDAGLLGSAAEGRSMRHASLTRRRAGSTARWWWE